MRALLALALLATPVAAAPPGAEACDGADRSEAAYQACIETVVLPCDVVRAGAGDRAWAECLLERASAWEDEIGARSMRLRSLGHEAGAPAAIQSYLVQRNEVCRDPVAVAPILEEHGRDTADGVVLRCELINNLHRALLLDRLAREAAAQ